jgi:hypothetical protein
MKHNTKDTAMTSKKKKNRHAQLQRTTEANQKTNADM